MAGLDLNIRPVIPVEIPVLVVSTVTRMHPSNMVHEVVIDALTVLLQDVPPCRGGLDEILCTYILAERAQYMTSTKSQPGTITPIVKEELIGVIMARDINPNFPQVPIVGLSLMVDCHQIFQMKFLAK